MNPQCPELKNDLHPGAFHASVHTLCGPLWGGRYTKLQIDRKPYPELSLKRMLFILSKVGKV